MTDDPLGRALDEFMEGLGESVTRLAVSVGRFALAFTDACRIAYSEVGSPYGHCDEGLYRWMKERLQQLGAEPIAHLRSEMLDELWDWFDKMEDEELAE